MEVITISPIDNPNKILLYPNHEIKIVPIIIKFFLCCDSWYTHQKYVPTKIVFKYTVPVQETKNVIF